MMVNKSLFATGAITFVGSTALAYAIGSAPHIALAWGTGWTCIALTLHRILKGITEE